MSLFYILRCCFGSARKLIPNRPFGSITQTKVIYIDKFRSQSARMAYQIATPLWGCLSIRWTLFAFLSPTRYPLFPQEDSYTTVWWFYQIRYRPVKPYFFKISSCKSLLYCHSLQVSNALSQNRDISFSIPLKILNYHLPSQLPTTHRADTIIFKPF